ncbi:PAS domain-containing protein tyrosine kinasefamily protein [Striga asiatica]|uniref:PAS domain-containing protein tyrosine kinasefamily protein n=1 Tax=Striga asiatica TaxID=4170 RepID=A0A5A7RFP0_STRAF|nr:PAS domain-containing protein tyrosine kinasefamily protein [Striga asiatica]
MKRRVIKRKTSPSLFSERNRLNYKGRSDIRVGESDDWNLEKNRSIGNGEHRREVKQPSLAERGDFDGSDFGVFQRHESAVSEGISDGLRSNLDFRRAPSVLVTALRPRTFRGSEENGNFTNPSIVGFLVPQ